ncbi:TetR/AcrR family transcriptional regulator [Labrys okinawensis]|uniref:TetR/AcrR family transcriptional regulator n=1 Tax=Labrys okinawensis TaxID=346911 RepID=UPI0039BC85DB
MSTQSSMRELILDAAETRVRAVGYKAVSFRELAEDVGVKSASVHYHFPQKTDLGVQLVERYAARFRASLDTIDQSDLLGAISAFATLYADALVVGESMCLCAVLGAEANGLPPEINAKVRDFFQMNIAWLTELNQQYGREVVAMLPSEIVASLEGAMIISNSTDDRNVMNRTIARILDGYKP